jgi:hypothetical protein
MIRRLLPIVSTAALAGAFVFSAPESHAFTGVTSEVSSALAIAKSTNRNQVHYAVQVDDACAPAGSAPVRPYWRMLEKSPDATEPLGHFEQRAFGIAKQDVDGENVRISLRALPARPITIHTQRGEGGKCTSSASATINGVPARIDNVFVKLKLFGVDYVQLTGIAKDGSVVRERLGV